MNSKFVVLYWLFTIVSAQTVTEQLFSEQDSSQDLVQNSSQKGFDYCLEKYGDCKLIIDSTMWMCIHYHILPNDRSFYNSRCGQIFNYEIPDVPFYSPLSYLDIVKRML